MLRRITLSVVALIAVGAISGGVGWKIGKSDNLTPVAIKSTPVPSDTVFLGPTSSKITSSADEAAGRFLDDFDNLTVGRARTAGNNYVPNAIGNRVDDWEGVGGCQIGFRISVDKRKVTKVAFGLPAANTLIEGQPAYGGSMSKDGLVAYTPNRAKALIGWCNAIDTH
jgi:hypothetical protein